MGLFWGKRGFLPCRLDLIIRLSAESPSKEDNDQNRNGEPNKKTQFASVESSRGWGDDRRRVYGY
jgi:hypothetical protein